MTLQAALGVPSNEEAPDGEESSQPSMILSPSEMDTTTVVEKNQQCTCKDCGKVFNSVWYLKQHAVKHSNDRPFKCKYCYKTYKFRSNLYQHKCPDRIKPLNSKRSRPLKQPPRDSPSAHSTSSGGASTPNSAPPGSFFDTQQRLTEEASPRRRSDSLDDRLAQPIYNQRFVDAYVQRHRHRLHQCRKCKMLFPTREYLSRHTASHAYVEARVHTCLHCSQTFELERDYAKHKQFHVPQSPHMCPRCGGTFRSALALRRHFDQSRACMCDDVLGMSDPINQYAFIDKSDADRYDANADDPVATNGDSGLGSSSDSNHSFNPSPVNSVELGSQYHHHTDFTEPSNQQQNDADIVVHHSSTTSTNTNDVGSGRSFSLEQPSKPSSGGFSALHLGHTRGTIMAGSTLNGDPFCEHEGWAEEDEDDFWRSLSPVGQPADSLDLQHASVMLMPPTNYHHPSVHPLISKETLYQPPRLASPREAGILAGFDMDCFDLLGYDNATLTPQRHMSGTDTPAAVEQTNVQSYFVALAEGEEAEELMVEPAPAVSNNAPYACVDCNRSFDNRRQLDKHKRQHVLNKAQRQNAIVCAECWEVFGSRRELVDHKLVEHKEDRPHICDECGKGFRRLGNLNDHRAIHDRTHSTSSPALGWHKCAFCPQQFRFRRNKKRHQKSCKACRLEHPYGLNGSNQLIFKPTSAAEQQPAHNDVRPKRNAGGDQSLAPLVALDNNEPTVPIAQHHSTVRSDNGDEAASDEEEEIVVAGGGVNEDGANDCAGGELVPDTLIFPELNVTVTKIAALRSGGTQRRTRSSRAAETLPGVSPGEEQGSALVENVGAAESENDTRGGDDNPKPKFSKRDRLFYRKPQKGAEKWRVGLKVSSSDMVTTSLREPCEPDWSGMWPCPKCWKKFPQRTKLRMHLAFHGRAATFASFS